MYNISFIIPTYNNYEMLLRCIASVENQMFYDDEIIIIDDGSNDGTYKKLLDRYKEKNNFIILRQKNSGSGTARNNGIENSTKEYIWFVDSDDYILDGSLKKARNVLKEQELDLLIFDFKVKTEDGEKDVHLNLNTQDYNDLMLGLHFPWNKIIKKKLFKEIKFPTVNIRYQDHATIPAVLAQASKIKYVNDSFYFYDFSHENNISKQNKKNDHMYIAFNNLINYREKNIIKDEEMDVLFIKSFIFSHLFQPKTTDFKQIIHNTKKIKIFLDKECPKWKKSKCLKLSFGRKYKNKVKAIKVKIILGKILKYNVFVPSVLVYFYLSKMK